MCGIVAVAGAIAVKEERMLRTLLILDTLRGEDSTGIAAIPKTGEVLVAKELGSPFDLFPSRKFVSAMKQVNRAIIGHNRFATSGGVSKASAHPFDFDTLVGVHNGTLRNKHNLDDAKEFSVDSENLYHHIEKNGLKHALSVVDGAYALVWWDKGNETLNLLRNKERPMYLTISEDNKTIFSASESWMLTTAADRSEIKIKEIISTVEDMHYSFHIDKNGVLAKPKVQHMASTFVPTAYYNNNSNWNKKQGTALMVVAPAVEKELPPSAPIPDGLMPYYVGKKGITFEVVGKKTDKNGSVYVNLMDPNWPAADIRMYPQKNDIRSYKVGVEIKGEVSSATQSDGFFKISPHSVTIIPEKKQFIYDNGKGHKLSKTEWEEKFPHCDWCFDPLFAEDHGNRLNNAGGCFCGKCATDKEATEYMQLKSVY